MTDKHRPGHFPAGAFIKINELLHEIVYYTTNVLLENKVVRYSSCGVSTDIRRGVPHTAHGKGDPGHPHFQQNVSCCLRLPPAPGVPVSGHSAYIPGSARSCARPVRTGRAVSALL